jgi:hypothetical protein
MPKKKSAKKEEESFNWKGITDNKDGTFTVSDGHAKKRLMKEFRRQGIRAHSKRTGEKGFVVFPVGQRKQRARTGGRLPRKERERLPGYKPRTRVRVAGPRPYLRQQARPGFGSPPAIHTGGAGARKHPIREAVMKAAEQRAQKTRESQRSPYTPEGKPRPGYQTYVDPKTGVQHIVKMPKAGKEPSWWMSRKQKEAIHQARVQESREIEKGMAERSKGQPSTRIPEPQRAPGGHIIKQKPAPERVRRTSELPAEPHKEPHHGPITGGVKRTSELPEHKVDYQKMQHERAEAMEKFQKIKLGEE